MFIKTLFRTRTALHGTALVLCGLCAGCVYSARYPADWPRPEAVGEGCPDISGTYVEHGESALLDQVGMRSAPASLSDYFFGQGDPRDILISISQLNEQSISVAEVHAGDALRTRDLNQNDDYSCTDGKIWFDRGNWIGEGSVEDLVFYAGGEKARLGFSGTADGSLLGEFHTRGAVLAVVVPIVGGEDDYILWRNAR